MVKDIHLLKKMRILKTYRLLTLVRKHRPYGHQLCSSTFNFF